MQHHRTNYHPATREGEAAPQHKVEWRQRELTVTLIMTLIVVGVYSVVGAFSVIWMIFAFSILLIASGFYKQIPHTANCLECKKVLHQDYLRMVSNPSHPAMKLSYRPKDLVERHVGGKEIEFTLRFLLIVAIFVGIFAVGEGAFWVVAAAGAAILATQHFASTRASKQANIWLGQSGICIQYSNGYTARMTSWLPWKSVERVSLVRSTEAIIDDAAVEFRVETQKISERDRDVWMFLSNIFNPVRIDKTHFSFELLLDGFSSQEERNILRSVIETYIEVDKICWYDQDIALTGKAVCSAARAPLTVPRNTSYTELWLCGLSPGQRRVRLESLACGDTLSGGKYTIVSLLGTGGQGTAYSAIMHGKHGATVIVLKEFVLPQASERVRERALEHIEREAHLLAGLCHPQIVSVYDFFIEDERAYLVLEKIEGTSLREMVEQNGFVDEQKLIHLALQMCDILSYLHKLTPPVIHRDFTPENLILERSGRLKLLDFNVAQQLESNSTRTVVGKHAYVPPEQFRGKATIQSDIYALGATLSFLLTGEDPEPISSSHPRLGRAAVSEQLDAIVSQATEPATDHRYPDSDALSRALLALKDEHRIGALRIS